MIGQCPCGAPHTADDLVLVLPAIFTNMVTSHRGRFELEPPGQGPHRTPRGVLATVRSCAACGTLYAERGEELGKRFEPNAYNPSGAGRGGGT